MKHYVNYIYLCVSIALSVLMGTMPVGAERVVILHTNDVHSNIRPSEINDMGGVLRRKALIDSVRAAEPNMLLIDAGDAVQGTLYFVLYNGEVETHVMNRLGYDIAILGNHDFDNGVDALARNVKNLGAELISSNYDFTGTPMEGLATPYTTRSYGDTKIAFMGINIAPDGLIDEENFAGVTYHDAIGEANKLARKLKDDGADMVVAITHIGFNSKKKGNTCLDPNLAAGSSDIDLIIGAHSHTVVTPATPGAITYNINGLPVVITQTGSNGESVGEVVIDTDTHEITTRLIAVDSRWDNRTNNAELVELIDMYSAKVDSVANVCLGYTPTTLTKKDNSLLNLASDMLLDRALLVVPDVDFAIMNKGGIRRDIPAGDLLQGAVIEAFPFNNHLTVVEMSADSVLTLLTSLVEGEGVGISRGSEVQYDASTRQLQKVLINGNPVDPSRRYRIATIDYLAKGNDGFLKIPRSEWVVRGDVRIYDELIPYILERKGAPIEADTTQRIYSIE